MENPLFPAPLKQNGYAISFFILYLVEEGQGYILHPPKYAKLYKLENVSVDLVLNISYLCWKNR